MKRKDLKVGMEVAFVPSTQRFNEGRNLLGAPVMAYVMATRPWIETGTFHRAQLRETSEGRGVAVALMYDFYGEKEWKPEVVQLSQLRGPWAAGQKEWKANQARARKWDREADQRRKLKAVQGKERLKRVKEVLGVEAYSRDGGIWISNEGMDELLARTKGGVE